MRTQTAGELPPIGLPTNRNLEGNAAPVDEEQTLTQLTVVGELPDDLDGSFFQIGPNPEFIHDIETYHPFDGDGMIDQVTLSGGRAIYRNRWVQTEGLQAERLEGRSLWRGLNHAPRFFGKYKLFKNVANTAVIKHAGRLLAMWEGGRPYALDMELNTFGPTDFGDRGLRHFTAHPKLDPRSNELVAFGAHHSKKPYLEHYVIGADGLLTQRTTVPIRRPVMMHDFAITEHYSVFLYWPLLFDLKRAIFGKAPWRFDAGAGAKIGVLARHAEGNTIQWFAVEPGFGFHTINAYESGNSIVLESEYMPEIDVLEFEIDKRSYCRWELDLDRGTSTREEITSGPLIFPSVHPERIGVKHELIWSGFYAPNRPCPIAVKGFLKVDLRTGNETRYDHGPGRWSGEPQFAPRPGSTDEDDGWLVGYVWDESTDQSEFVVLDASDLEAGPIARILLGERVPFGFHTRWERD